MGAASYHLAIYRAVADVGEPDRMSHISKMPVINSPYDFPCWHYRVDNSGLAIRGDASPGIWNLVEG